MHAFTTRITHVQYVKWYSASNRIPQKDEHSHYIDGDRLDDRSENLELTTSSSGQILLKESRVILSVSLMGGQGHVFESALDASVCLGMTRDIVHRSCGK